MTTVKIKELKAPNSLLTLPFLCCLSILIINDFYLKQLFHNTITGKLSDICGLFIFPLFINEIWKGRKLIIFISTGSLFILWKMPCADLFIEKWNSLGAFKIERIVDFSDLLALLILPISYYYKPREISLTFIPHKFLYVTVFGISMFGIIATAGTIGSIKKYNFDESKHLVSDAFNTLVRLYPEYKVPDSLVKYTVDYKDSEKGILKNEIGKMTADSVSFHIFLENEQKVFWIKFDGAASGWDEKKCVMSLTSVTNIFNGKKRFRKDLNDEESQRIDSVFHISVIDKLHSILNSKEK